MASTRIIRGFPSSNNTLIISDISLLTWPCALEVPPPPKTLHFSPAATINKTLPVTSNQRPVSPSAACVTKDGAIAKRKECDTDNSDWLGASWAFRLADRVAFGGSLCLPDVTWLKIEKVARPGCAEKQENRFADGHSMRWRCHLRTDTLGNGRRSWVAANSFRVWLFFAI